MAMKEQEATDYGSGHGATSDAISHPHVQAPLMHQQTLRSTDSSQTQAPSSSLSTKPSSRGSLSKVFFSPTHDDTPRASSSVTKAKMESKITPSRRVQRTDFKVGSKLKSTPPPPPPSPSPCDRPCQQHSFLTDITDVRQMEQGLLQLLEDFHSGKLQAFGKDCSSEKMEHVREQQERLARLHFDLNAQQELCGPQSDEGKRMGKENLAKLIENLQQLSLSIEQLQSTSSGVQTDV